MIFYWNSQHITEEVKISYLNLRWIISFIFQFPNKNFNIKIKYFFWCGIIRRNIFIKRQSIFILKGKLKSSISYWYVNIFFAFKCLLFFHFAKHFAKHFARIPSSNNFLSQIVFIIICKKKKRYTWQNT